MLLLGTLLMGITSEQHSSASSIDSSCNPSAAAGTSSSSFCAPIQSNNSTRFDLSTDLRLGLSISSSYYNDLFPTPTTTTREQPLSWPPIRSILRSAHLDKALDQKQAFLFIKIYMEGIPIGRKLNLFAQDGYDSLMTTIAHMFPTTILCPGADRVHSDKYHVLTYEDKEGDWMMVGDVPWEMFLNNVKRLKITRADRC
ncbi:auxin-responsive protein IAA31-like isoform X1 [Quercus lobata]|nr:auxin-responsive protein IAA31-like isoform X1 [Quercus lobata]